MKFVHIADVHLGLLPDAGKKWSQRRRKDIWESFCEVIQRTGELSADLLLIAGDLFHRQPLKRELKEVAAQFASIPDTQIVLIAGNHDYVHPKSYYRSFEWPQNVHFLLHEQLECIRLEALNTTVWGCSFWQAEDARRIYDQGISQQEMAHQNMSRQNGYHILLGHGGDEKHHPFSASQIAKAGYDYAAFGHIHKAQQMVPGKVIMAGALEPTDCNDFGPHGYWAGELTERGCLLSFFPIKKCEYIRQEVAVTPKMTGFDILEEVKAVLRERESYQISHIILRGYRDSDVKLPMDEIETLERVVRIVDKTEPDYQFDRLLREYEGTLLARYIETMQKYPGQQTARAALYYGVQAIMEAMEEA